MARRDSEPAIPRGAPLTSAPAIEDRSAGDEVASGAAEPSLRAWMSVGILLLLTFSSNIDRNIIGMLVDPIKADLRIDDVEFSLLQGFAFALFFAIASFPMGWLADRYSRRWVLALSVSFWSACTAACGLANNFPQLLVARFGVGVGEAALNPSAYSIVSDLFPKRRLTLALACLASGAAIAAGVGAVCGGYIIRWANEVGGLFGHAPWQMVFWVVGVPGLLIAPLVFLIPKPTRIVDTAQVQPQAFSTWLRGNGLYFGALSLGIGAHTALGASVLWLPALLTRTQGLPIDKVGLLVGLVTGVPTIIGYIGGGWLVDRLFARGVRDIHLVFLAVNTLLLGVIGTIAYGFVSDLRLLLILLSLNSVLLPCAGPAIAHIQMSAPVSARSRAAALFLMIMHIVGMTAGPSGAAMFSEYFYGGPQHIGKGLATLYAIGGSLGLVCFILAIKPARRALARGMDLAKEV